MKESTDSSNTTIEDEDTKGNGHTLKSTFPPFGSLPHVALLCVKLLKNLLFFLFVFFMPYVMCVIFFPLSKHVNLTFKSV